MLVGPNDEVLSAQRRICTGPYQSRPLTNERDSPNPEHILELIFGSLAGRISKENQVSRAQMGAFFTAMRIRQTFGEGTRWSAAESAAFDEAADLLDQLPIELRFLLKADSKPLPNADEVATVKALKVILSGDHLSYEQNFATLTEILTGRVRPEWAAAVLIGQRMNIENDEEISAYLDAPFTPSQVRHIDVPTVTHFGQPFDGARRYFRPTLFVAAVRAALGRHSVLIGVDSMPPKDGITEEQLLKALGANVHISIERGEKLLLETGMVYLSQRDYSPGLYALRELRAHIAKRPVWSTTEKAQQLYHSTGRNCGVVGFYHAGYEKKLLQIMRARCYNAGIALKGEEGTCNYGLRLGKPSDAARKAINYSEGFRGPQQFSEDIDPKYFDMNYDYNPRPLEVSVESFINNGMDALRGHRGTAYDRIALSAGVIDSFLGFCPSAEEGVKQARRMLDSGLANKALNHYIEETLN